MVPLSQLDVLVVDCQATAASPRGYLLELGWARAGPAASPAQARLIELPECERIPPAVARITGISDSMIKAGIDPDEAWRELSQEASRLPRQPGPTVIHFARFERPFLERLAGGSFPLEIVCTHEIARRLLPDLPRRSLRALAGYFGRAVAPLRRSADHVEATAFVWQELVSLLAVRGVSTWSALRDWVAAPFQSPSRPRRVWPMPRDVRLALPDRPGLYRMLRKSGDVLYVGKALSLNRRVNSYFRHQHGVNERLLEMLSQARGVSFEVTPSALEAALDEPDEIKRHRPPYNVALADDRELWFAPADLSGRRLRASGRFRLGPFPYARLLDQFAALAHAERAALGGEPSAPDAATFEAGYSRLCSAHVELSLDGLDAPARLLRMGTRLWQEGRRDRDRDRDSDESRAPPRWLPEDVQLAMERLAIGAAHACRRARWLTRLTDAAVVWSEPGVDGARLIVIESGEVVLRADAEPGTVPPIPPGYQRSTAARQASLTLARFDRLRVLTTELKRLQSEGSPAAVRFGPSKVLAGLRLARALSWV